MKKHTYTIAALALLTLCSVSAAKAQSANQRLVANIPFEFNAGNETLQAGQYEVIVVNPSSDRRVVKISSLDRKQGILLQTHSITAKKTANARLVFHRYGNQYFLAQAWSGSDGFGMEPSMSASERLVMNQYQGVRKVETVALSHH